MKRVNWGAWVVVMSTVTLSTSNLFAQTPSVELPSYGWLLTKTVLVLIGVCLLAFAGLRWLAKLHGQRAVGQMQVLAKLPLEPRRSMFVVKVGERGLIVGTSESGMNALGELTAAELLAFEVTPDQTTSEDVVMEPA